MADNYFFDTTPCGVTAPDSHAVILMGYGSGAAPQIFQITWSDLRDRLESIMAWHPQYLDLLEKQMKDAGRLSNIPLPATLGQLRSLGFQGI